MTPEGRVKKDIKDWLKEIGVWYCMPVTGGYGKRLVDFLVCWNGVFVAVEVKRPGKDAETFQGKILEQVRQAGGYGFTVDSVDLLREFFEYVVRPGFERHRLPDV